MLKHEVKIEFQNSEVLKSIIEKSYFEEGTNGKLFGKSNYLVMSSDIEPEAFEILKEVKNSTVKICNQEIIDGSIRFIVEETEGELRMYPASIYCVKEEDKYSFY